MLFLLLSFLILGSLSYPDGTVVQLYTCNGSDRQKWQYHPEDLTLRLRVDDKCLDISNYGTDDGSEIWLYGCHTGDKDPNHQNQEFKMNDVGSSVTFTSTLSGKCVEANAQGTTAGTIIDIWQCTNANNQKWIYNANDGTVKGVQSNLCLDAGSPIPRPCDNPANQFYPFCNYKLSFNDRVKDLVSRIPLAEKYGLFGNGAKNIASYNISSYQWWSEALHGVAGSPGVRFVPPTPVATSFPQVIGLGATFDAPLVHQVGDVISTEARGFYHEGNAGLTYWAPNVNLYRDPRWGRGQETPGEDPYLAVEYSRNFVSGMQGNDPRFLKVSSCCKHYTAYDLEDWNGVDRHHFNAIVTDQDMMDSFMPSFRSCIQGGKASSLMCSYNAVNGVPSCANKLIMTDYARNQWGFQGYITGDCGAVDDVQYTHQYTSTTDATCKATIEAGLDIDCGGFLQAHLGQAVQDGAVSSNDLANSLIDQFLVEFRLGFYDPLNAQPYTNISAAQVNTQDHQALALTVARESMVLLKNDNSLPFDKSKISNIAVIGPNGQATGTMQGNYAGNAPYLVSPDEGIQKYAKTTYTKGADINSNDQSGFNAACSAAQSADATVLVVGLDQSQESEGRDRTSIDLPGVQNQLITKVASCSKGPLVVVVMTGGPVDLSVPKNTAKVNAILWVGYPGQSGGDAIAQTLFGDNNPAGRLPYTIYPANYVNQVSMFDMGMRPNASNGNPGRTYRFYTGTPVYEFGTGLSYTQFNYTSSSPERVFVSSSDLENILQSEVTPDIYAPWQSKKVGDITITVTNVGQRAGDAVVLAYINPPNAGKNGNPIQYLFGFSRVHNLAPGAKQSVTFPTTAHDLTLVNEFGKRVTVPGVFTAVVGDVEQQIVVE